MKSSKNQFLLLALVCIVVFSNCKNEDDLIVPPVDDDVWVLQNYSIDGEMKVKYFYDELGRITEIVNYEEQMAHSKFEYNSGEMRPFRRNIYGVCGDYIGAVEYEYNSKNQLTRVNNEGISAQFEIPLETIYEWDSNIDCGPVKTIKVWGTESFIGEFTYTDDNCSGEYLGYWENDPSNANHTRFINTDQKYLTPDPTGLESNFRYNKELTDLQFGNITTIDYQFNNYGPSGFPDQMIMTYNPSGYTVNQDFEWVNLNQLALPQTNDKPDYRLYQASDARIVGAEFVNIMIEMGKELPDNTTYDESDPLWVDGFSSRIIGSSNTTFENSPGYYKSTKVVEIEVDFGGYSFNQIEYIGGKATMSWTEVYIDDNGLTSVHHDYTITVEEGTTASFTGPSPNQYLDLSMVAVSTDGTSEHFLVEMHTCSGEYYNFNY